MNEMDVVRMLQIKYPAPEWAFFDHVANGTGAAKSRTMDALAFNLWTSRGLEINGFEVKVSRSDWLSEMKNPQKAEEGMKYCDYRWLAVGYESIIKPEELPAGWGLYVAKGSRLFKIKEAKKSEYTKPIDRIFAAALARKAYETSFSDERLASMRQEGIKIGVEREKLRYERELINAHELAKEYKDQIDEFTKHLGLQWRDIRYSKIEDIATAIHLFNDYGLQRALSDMRELQKHLTETIEQTEKTFLDHK